MDWIATTRSATSEGDLSIDVTRPSVQIEALADLVGEKVKNERVIKCVA